MAHNELGHNGTHRTYILLKRLYYWKGLKPSVEKHIKMCYQCQRRNRKVVKYTTLHFDVPMGYMFCVPLKTKTAEEVTQAYIDNVYSKVGGSLKILCDNGTEFKNKVFEQVAKELGVVYKLYTPPYHPASNGRIEGFHDFLSKAKFLLPYGCSYAY